MPEGLDLPAAYWFLAAMSFVVGAVCGSFFNVCIYRIPANKSIAWPPSHCYACGGFIRWYDNIPILSYFILGGTCRDCAARFSPRYMLVELLTGLLFLGLFLIEGPHPVVLCHFAFAGLLVVGTFTDVDHYIIPDGVTVGGLVFALAASALLGMDSVAGREAVEALRDGRWLAPELLPRSLGQNLDRMVWVSRAVALGWSLVGAAVGWAILFGVGKLGHLIFRKEAMGGGDIKLMAFLGAYLGPVACFYVLGISTVLGAVIGVSAIAAHRLVGKDEFEDITLDPGRLAARFATNDATQSPDQGVDSTGTGEPADPEAEEAAGPRPIVLRVAVRTSRQMHYFPFGPYLAVAALAVLFALTQFDALTRNLFLLP